MSSIANNTDLNLSKVERYYLTKQDEAHILVLRNSDPCYTLKASYEAVEKKTVDLSTQSTLNTKQIPKDTDVLVLGGRFILAVKHPVTTGKCHKALFRPRTQVQGKEYRIHKLVNQEAYKQTINDGNYSKPLRSKRLARRCHTFSYPRI